METRSKVYSLSDVQSIIPLSLYPCEIQHYSLLPLLLLGPIFMAACAKNDETGLSCETVAKLMLRIPVAASGSTQSVIEADTTDQINVDLESDINMTVDTQLSATSQLRVIILFSTYYSEHLGHVFSDGATNAADTLMLDAPQLYSAGNLASIGVSPTQIKLQMPVEGQAATVNIFVVRDTTLYRIAGDGAGKKSKAFYSVQPDRSVTAWNSTQANDSLF